MNERLVKLKENALAKINEADSLDKLNDIRVAFLGKKGELTEILKGMKDVAPEERPKVGQIVNETRAAIEEVLEDAKKSLASKALEAKLKSEVIDVTLPAKKTNVGHSHPNTLALEEVKKIFVGMGYEVVEGPEVEYDYYNFEALNIPANHPAKDEQDTFYIDEKTLLRTQTSSVQVHEMERGKLPIKMISPGRVYRADEVDATHSPCFHQVEGMVIDENITFADLKGTLAEFAKQLFGPETKVKFRPHHFPFTEPSAEMDVSCFKCGGKGCRMCKGEGWIEILGCGMIHPHVFEMSGIDKDKYTGFAFGIGLERIALLKYEIDDMRLLYENDERFLKQF
ncbi:MULTISPECIES: phenylalanine--tRNA ligase subunit alpha [Lachnospira]|uniref:Phenylalanine--tRNA ligase alpha subunit n=2 Tax=Lachnospira TaxID=28050 RepID=A0A1H5SDP5_9FIRM|nr:MULTISPECIES: phenylalanine--tRNA ligase subunit alpha [Lachnospira]MCR5516250.1 phenylalanine--tRNA ligase subunit alpha [Lachnospira sp.]SDM55794.1 phenylalanyl-tRNA synthetase, alpha subunit [Lachnospira pectinoschiza]SEF47877.1 phenylalanyl-tRNA synthetase, alpha subunit [Lachnospira multipara]